MSLGQTTCALLLALCAGGTSPPPSAGSADCAGFSGVGQSRCERQALMDAKCTALTGAARLACARAHFLANPLVCPAASDDVCPCHLERHVVKVCGPDQGLAFESCLRRHGDFGVIWHAPEMAPVAGSGPSAAAQE